MSQEPFLDPGGPIGGGYRGITVFSGTAHLDLADEICAELGIDRSPSKVRRFANTCIEVQLMANCRERDVFLVQTLTPNVQEHLVELLMMINAARGASAARICVVMPHFAYARSDKKETPRISLGGRLVADLLVAAGADRVLTMTLHAPQVHGFFGIPVDHLNALDELSAHFQLQDLSNTVVVSPDLGNAKSAAALARMLGLTIAAANKERISDREVRIASMVGDIRGRHVIVLDDEIARGTSLVELIEFMRTQDVQSVRVACTHGLFVDGAVQRIAAYPEVTEIVCTNTVPIPADTRIPQLKVLTVAPLLAEAVRRIHNGESVSALFEHHEQQAFTLFARADSSA